MSEESDASWLLAILNETETEIKSWPAWLKASSLKNPPPEDITESNLEEHLEEFDQQVG